MPANTPQVSTLLEVFRCEIFKKLGINLEGMITVRNANGFEVMEGLKSDDGFVLRSKLGVVVPGELKKQNKFSIVK